MPMFGYAVDFSLNTPYNLLILECLLTMNGLKLVRLEPALYRRLALDDDPELSSPRPSYYPDYSNPRLFCVVFRRL